MRARWGPRVIAVMIAVAGAVAYGNAASAVVPGQNGPIAFASNRDGGAHTDIYTVNPDGSNPLRLTSTALANESGPAVSPDGSKIAYLQEPGASLLVMDADGGGQTQLNTGLVGPGGPPAWSPDGTKLVFEGVGPAPGGYTTGRKLWVMDATGGNVKQLTANTVGHSYADDGPSWSPDGTRIAFNSNINGHNQLFTIGATPAVTSVDGGDARVQLTQTPGDLGATPSSNDAHPSWSPDGTSVAFDRAEGNDNTRELWTIPVNAAGAPTATPTRLTNDSCLEAHPSWAPDGTRIVFQSDCAGHLQIFTMAPTAGASATLVMNTTSGIADTDPDWSGVAVPPIPVNTAVPWISGVAREGQTLTEMRGTWRHSPSSYNVQWQRCDTAGANCVAITGETQATYTLTGSDVGKRVRVQEWATNTSGTSGPASSLATTVVQATPPGEPCGDQKVGFGVIQAKGCFTQQGGAWVSRGTLWINGISLLPVGGAHLTIKTAAGTLDSGTGEFSVEAAGNVLYRGKIAWSLGAGGSGTTVNLAPPAGATIGGLASVTAGAGQVQQQLTFNMAASIPAAMARAQVSLTSLLRALCGNVCPAVLADVSIRTNNLTGVPGDGIRLVANREFLFGPATVKKLDMTLVPASATWQGEGTIVLPTPNPLVYHAEWLIERGLIKNIAIEQHNTNTAVAWGVILHELKMALSTANRSIALTGSLSLTAGPQVLGMAPIAIDGRVLASLAAGSGGLLDITGQTRIMNVKTSGYVKIWTGGGISFGANVAIGLPNPAGSPSKEPVFVRGALAGWLERYTFDAESSAELWLLGQKTGSAELLFSSVGMAACGQIGWLRAGFGQRWSAGGAFGTGGHVMGDSCDLAPYRPYRAAKDAAGGGITLNLPAAQRGVMVRFRGQDGPPRVVLDGPGGQHVAATGTRIVNDRFVVLEDPTTDVTYVVIHRPAGRWHVTTAAGSTPIVRVDSAATLTRPSITARVSGTGAKRTLTWKLRQIHGQRVTFAEEGKDSAHVITTTSAAKGKVRFAPARGNVRARKIVAIVLQNGMPRGQLVVAHYKAPAWGLPAKPTRLSAKHKGTSLSMSWRPPAGAARQIVVISLPKRPRQQFVLGTRTRTFRITVPAKVAWIQIEVAGLRSDNRAGPSARLRLK